MTYFECVEICEDDRSEDVIFDDPRITVLFDEVIDYYEQFLSNYETTRSEVENNVFYSRLLHDLKALRNSITQTDEAIRSEWRVRSPRKKYHDDNLTEMDYRFTLVFRRRHA